MSYRLFLSLCFIFIFVMFFIGVRYGHAEIEWDKIFNILLYEMKLISLEETGFSEQERVIIWHIRIPRIITASLVGASLALSGVMLQGLFQNPMASPFVIGISNGGALGATAAIAMGLGTVSVWSVPFMAFGGALISVFVVSLLATHKGKTPIATLILCGIAINSIAGAFTMLLLSISVSDFEIARKILFWLMGSLVNRTWDHVLLVAPFFFVCATGAIFFSRELNMMMSGEESAKALGVNTVQTKLWILVISAASAGVSVAVSGVIGFVGLLVPHIVRLLVGPDHRRLLPASILAGSIFLMGADFLARWISSVHEIQLGIFSAGIGGPFFLYLVMKNRYKAEII